MSPSSSLFTLHYISPSLTILQIQQMSELYLGRVPGGDAVPAPAVRPSPYVGGDVKVCFSPTPCYLCVLLSVVLSVCSLSICHSLLHFCSLFLILLFHTPYSFILSPLYPYLFAVLFSAFICFTLPPLNPSCHIPSYHILHYSLLFYLLLHST